MQDYLTNCHFEVISNKKFGLKLHGRKLNHYEKLAQKEALLAFDLKKSNLYVSYKVYSYEEIN